MLVGKGLLGEVVFYLTEIAQSSKTYQVRHGVGDCEGIAERESHKSRIHPIPESRTQLPSAIKYWKFVPNCWTNF
jgi:hypothetical protein